LAVGGLARRQQSVDQETVRQQWRIIEGAILRLTLQRNSSMSLFNLSRWRPMHLLLAWATYWIALLVVALGPAVPAILRATRPNAHGEINASFNNSVFSLTVKEAGQLLWSASIHAFPLALWIGVPPLILFALWLRGRSGALHAGQARRA
jgi:hypothetical protein